MQQKLTYEQLMEMANVQIPIPQAEPKYKKIAGITPIASAGRKSYEELLNSAGRTDLTGEISRQKQAVGEYNKTVDDRLWYENYNIDEAKAKAGQYKSEIEKLNDIISQSRDIVIADDPNISPSEQNAKIREEAENKNNKLRQEMDKLQSQISRYETIKSAEKWQEDNEKYNALTKEKDFNNYSKKVWEERNKLKKRLSDLGIDDKLPVTDEELDIYSYLLNTKGEEAAKEYGKHIQDIVNQRAGTKQAELLKGDWLGQQGYGIYSGLESFGQGVAQLFSEEALPTSSTQYAAAQIREDLPEGISRTVFDLTKVVGNLAPSIALATVTGGLGAPAVLVKGVGAISMGASASGNAYKEMLDAGYTNEQAKVFSVLTGISEAGLSYLFGGISKLGGKLSGNVVSKVASKIGNVYARIASETGMKLLAEGSEEYLQDVLSQIFHNVATGEDNEIKILSEEALYSFFLGGITAGLLEGGSVISSNIKANKAGNAITTAKKTNELVENALRLKPSTEAFKLALDIQKGKTKVNDINVGTLMK